MVSILLSTYNGEDYINDQIQSILQQTYKEWNLFIRDDGSIDKTVVIVKSLQKTDSRIRFIEDNRGNLGVVGSFITLLYSVESDYYMFCDQDDVWLPNKIERSLRCIKEKEISGENIPVLAYSDLKVVDAKLNIISESFFNYCGTDRLIKNPDFHYTGSMIPGCVMMFNKKARDLILDFKGFKHIIHDYGLVLKVISKNGCLASIPEALILYRQHNNNTMGAEYDRTCFWGRLKTLNLVYKKNKELYKEVKVLTGLPLWRYLYLKIQSIFLFNRLK